MEYNPTRNHDGYIDSNNEEPESKHSTPSDMIYRGRISQKSYIVKDSGVLAKQDVKKPRIPKVNDVVEVLWDADNEWFRGKLVKARGRVRVFRFDVQYDDGDYLTHDLNEEHWRFANDRKKTFEPGEIEELFREVEEKPYSIPPHMINPKKKKKTNNKYKYSVSRNGETGGIRKLRTAPQSLNEIPQLSTQYSHTSQNDDDSMRKNSNANSESESPSASQEERQRDLMPAASNVKKWRQNIGDSTHCAAIASHASGPYSPTSTIPTHDGTTVDHVEDMAMFDGAVPVSADHHLLSSMDCHLPLRKRRFSFLND